MSVGSIQNTPPAIPLPKPVQNKQVQPPPPPAPVAKALPFKVDIKA